MKFEFVQTPETFSVEEILPFEPSGSGAYTFVKLEKVDRSTGFVKQKISERTGVPLRHIHHAGLKDRKATAIQWLSWETAQQRSPLEDGDGFRILHETRNDMNLRVGLLAGNRFDLRLNVPMDFDESDFQVSKLPNFYGLQRFGSQPQFPVPWPQKKDRFEVSRLQSWYFNSYLKERLMDCGFECFTDDLFTRTNGSRVFQVENITELDVPGRSQACPTGPIPGYKMAKRLPAREQLFFEDQKLDLEDFRRYGKVALGARRPLWVSPVWHGSLVKDNELKIQFELPAGSYATILLAFLADPLFYEKEMATWPIFG